MENSSSQQQRLIELARSFRTAMVTTYSLDGGLHTRPMSIARIADNGDIWFATSANSAKLHEINAKRTASATMQGGLRFVAFSGLAESVFDPTLARSLWRESWRPWFPGGASDPELKLMCIRVEHGEFWDLRGARGVGYLFDMVRHAVSGTRMGDDTDGRRHGVSDFGDAAAY
jgi:general stress protein 26